MSYKKLKLLTVSTAALFFVSAHAQMPPREGPPPEGMGGPGGMAAETNPPVIDAFSFEGNRKISTQALLKDSSIEPGMTISKQLVGGEIQRIVALYNMAGYDLAISPDIQHPADGHVVITFKIDENGSGGDAGAAP